MTVKELIDKLVDFPLDAEVLVSRDAEGNGFSLLSDFGMYYGEKGRATRHGSSYRIVDEDDWEDFLLSDKDVEEDELPNHPFPGDNVLVLWP